MSNGLILTVALLASTNLINYLHRMLVAVLGTDALGYALMIVLTLNLVAAWAFNRARHAIMTKESS